MVLRGKPEEGMTAANPPHVAGRLAEGPASAKRFVEGAGAGQDPCFRPSDSKQVLVPFLCPFLCLFHSYSKVEHSLEGLSIDAWCTLRPTALLTLGAQHFFSLPHHIKTNLQALLKDISVHLRFYKSFIVDSYLTPHNLVSCNKMRKHAR